MTERPPPPSNELPAFGPTDLHDGDVERVTIGGDGSWVDIELSFLDLPLPEAVDDWGPHWHCVATVQLRSLDGLLVSKLGPKDNDCSWVYALLVDDPNGGAAVAGWLAPSVPQRLRAGRILLRCGGGISWADAVATLIVREGEPASPRGAGLEPGA